MATPEAPTPHHASDPGPQRFALTVRPASPCQTWHAWLCSDSGQRLDFATPIELLRHLTQLQSPLPPGNLK